MTRPTINHLEAASPRPPFTLIGILAYLIVPGHSLGWLSGLPLGSLGLAVTVFFGLVLFAVWPLHPDRDHRYKAWASLFGVLCAAKLAVAVVSPAYGLEAVYYTRPDSPRAPERSTDFPHLSATRIDRKLSFEGEEFPLYFFNDNLRFNYYREDEPDRSSLAFAALWRGWLNVPREAEYRFWLTSSGPARVDLGGTRLIWIQSPGDAQTVERELRLSAGSLPLEVQYTRPTGTAALLSLDSDLDGARAPLSAPFLLAKPIGFPPALTAPLLWMSRLLDTLFVTVLAVLSLSLLSARYRVQSRLFREPRLPVERLLLALLLALVFAYAALSTLDLRHKAIMLDGGSDWLTYETYARDIHQNGPLMTLGRALGRGRPYFFQPFYPYALAAAHWLTGEDLYGVVVLQLFGLGVAACLVYALAKRLFGPHSGILALILVLGLLGPLQLEWVARHLLSENIYFWLLPATALALIELARRPSRSTAVLSGLLLGLCCVTRGPTLLWVPLALLLTYRSTGSRSPLYSGNSQTEGVASGSQNRPGKNVWLAALVCVLLVLMVPLRNLVVSGHPALVATNAMATMELAHPLTPRVDLRGVENNPIYRGLRLDFSLIQFIEFIRQDPAGYAATLVPLGLYALGLPGALEEGSVIRWELVSLVVLYLVYVVNVVGRWAVKENVGSIQLSAPTMLLHSFIGLHFLMMMVFLPNVYGYRQVLPMYLFMAVFAGRMLARLTAGVIERAPKLEQRDRAHCCAINQYVHEARLPARHEELA